MSEQDEIRHEVLATRALGITVIVAIIAAWVWPWPVIGYTIAATGLCVIVDNRKGETVMVAFCVYIALAIFIYGLLDHKKNYNRIIDFFKKHLKE